jgi:MFS superfamily sulfate permease-like transporter
MTRSSKLGIASVVLLAGSPAPVTAPFGAVCLVLSCVLALMATQQGSKWWLVVPCTIVGVSAFILYLGLHGLYD